MVKNLNFERLIEGGQGEVLYNGAIPLGCKKIKLSLSLKDGNVNPHFTNKISAWLYLVVTKGLISSNSTKLISFTCNNGSGSIYAEGELLLDSETEYDTCQITLTTLDEGSDFWNYSVTISFVFE